MLQDVEKALKAAGDATRLRILRMLEGGPLCVCQVVEVLGLSQSTVSKHLVLLKDAGLIQGEKRGKWVFYRRLAGERGTFPGALGGLLSDFLHRERRAAEDLRKTRHPRVKKLAACCPQPRGASREAGRYR